MPRRLYSFLGLAVLFAASAISTYGQAGSSTMVGTLTDPADAMVPSGSITVTEQATGVARTATSNEAGLFRVLDLRPGRYTLRAEAAGFKALEIKDIELASSETRDLGRLVLQIGELAEEISVTAAATPVQTASSERSATIDSNQLTQVTLKGRDPFGYMRMVPGIVDMNNDRSQGGSASNISINGMTSNSKNVMFDGVTMLDQGGSNAVYVAPNIDAVAEMRVLSGTFQAEYGRTAGGAINMITKSGTQDFHGTGVWNRRHESMNANTFFNNREGIPRPIYRYFIGAYTIGGPIYVPGKINKDKRRAFFFFSQEFTRIAQPTQTTRNSLPTEAERAGDFSNSLNSVGALIRIIDPTTGKQFPGNKIPTSRIDPKGQAFLNVFLKPNGYVNPAPGQQYTSNFIASVTPSYRKSDSIIRVDVMLTDHMNLFVRYGKDNRRTSREFMVSPGIGTLINFNDGYQWTGHVTNVISPTMVNEAVVSAGGNTYGFWREGEPDSTYYRTSTLNPPTLRPMPTGPEYPPYLPSATFAGGALPNPGNFYPGWTGNMADGTNNNFPIPYANYNDTYTFTDDLSKVFGSHSLKTGVYYEYNSKIEPAAGNTYPGLFNFGSNVNNPLDTGHGYANALLGTFQTYTEASNRLIPNPHFTEVEAYIQDNWRVNRRLTLDYGVRFYHMGVMVDKADSYSNFYEELWDPKQAARIYRPATVGGKTVAIDPLTGNTTYAALQNTLVPGSGSAINGMNVNGLTGKSDFFSFPFLVFSPRLGFAYDVFGDGKMAVRGSFGTFYNRPNANFVQGRGVAPTIYTPVVYYSQIDQIPQAAASAAISPTNGTYYGGDWKIERMHQFNLTIQRDIGFDTVLDVAYVGTFNRNAQTTDNYNPIPQGAYANPANIFNNTAINANLLRTRFPGMGTVTRYYNGLSSLNYHGLQMQAQHRMSHGLQFGLAYTFSKALGTCGSVSSSSGCAIADAYHNYRDWYYGPMLQDRTHVFSANYSYRIPTVTSKAVMKHVVNNWTLSGAASFMTGAPVTPECSSISSGVANSDPSLSGAGAYSSSNVTGARCQAIADPQDFTQDFYHNFNTSAFTVAPVGTFGNIGLGILRQPSSWNVDMTLDKRIPLGKSERRTLRLRLEAYNVFNNTQFSQIGTTLRMQGAVNTNTTYGQYTATNPSRVLSTTVRFEF
jgi:hypothetical protein